MADHEGIAFDQEAQAADLIQEYEAKIAGLERMVGREAFELELLKGALKYASRTRSANTSIVTCPAVSPSLGCASRWAFPDPWHSVGNFLDRLAADTLRPDRVHSPKDPAHTLPACPSEGSQSHTNRRDSWTSHDSIRPPACSPLRASKSDVMAFTAAFPFPRLRSRRSTSRASCPSNSPTTDVAAVSGPGAGPRAGDINEFLDVVPRTKLAVPLMESTVACDFPSPADDYLDSYSISISCLLAT